MTGYRGWVFQTDDGTKFPERGVGLTPDISSKFADSAIEFIRRQPAEPFFLTVNNFGNTDLKEEHIDAFEVAYTATFGNTSISLAAYQNDTDDNINFTVLLHEQGEHEAGEHSVVGVLHRVDRAAELARGGFAELAHTRVTVGRSEYLMMHAGDADNLPSHVVLDGLAVALRRACPQPAIQRGRR